MKALLQKMNDLEGRMATIEKLLMSQKEYLSLDELAVYLNVEKSTIYTMTQAKTWTLFKPGGKLTYVKREEVDSWIESRAQMSAETIEQNANNYLLTKGA